MILGLQLRSEVYTAEQDIPEYSLIEIELAIEKLKRHKATGVDHIPSELIQAGAGKLYEEIHKLIVLIWNKKELPQEWKESIIVPIHKKGDRMDCNNKEEFHSCLLHIKFFRTCFYRE